MDAVFRSRTGTFSRARGALEIFCGQNTIQPFIENQLFTWQFPLLIKVSLLTSFFSFFLDSIYPFWVLLQVTLNCRYIFVHEVTHFFNWKRVGEAVLVWKASLIPPSPIRLAKHGTIVQVPWFPSTMAGPALCVKLHFLSHLLIKTEPSVGRSVFPETNRGVWRYRPCFAMCQLRLLLGCTVCLTRGYSVLYPVLPQNSPAWASARAYGEGGGVSSCPFSAGRAQESNYTYSGSFKCILLFSRITKIKYISEICNKGCSFLSYEALNMTLQKQYLKCNYRVWDVFYMCLSCARCWFILCIYIMSWKCVTYIILCFSLNIYLAKDIINTLIDWSTSSLYQVGSDCSMLSKSQTYKHLLQ